MSCEGKSAEEVKEGCTREGTTLARLYTSLGVKICIVCSSESSSDSSLLAGEELAMKVSSV